ncbi:hypothetical protein LMC05_10365 [Limosilactobacillus reuteri]|uniref:hypothetical protein n=1 Tax=Limosilactobacillus reuteri TaxID=1598 RepID=UPI001E2D9772|nr:hypothetical protein [Limosilactobacillus reuteri]MCC4509352.1 hypothetical protein [Limosilactobacillus reuteri]MCC4509395.1 hypothetical protein [Limosilactobacillus reuteri]
MKIGFDTYNDIPVESKVINSKLMVTVKADVAEWKECSKYVGWEQEKVSEDSNGAVYQLKYNSQVYNLINRLVKLSKCYQENGKVTYII